MVFWIFITLGLIIGYIILIFFYLGQWRQLKPMIKGQVDLDFPFVSIIIVGRNEAQNIPSCLSAILSSDYPKTSYEIIYVDDHSSDASISVLKSYDSNQLNILELKDYKDHNNSNAYKKSAIAYALSVAKGNLILHTDADTIPGKSWIKKHVLSYLDGAAFTAAPVLFTSPKGLLEGFQQLDLLTTMGVTAAGIQSGLHYLANGANMSYDRKLRETLSYEDGQNYASGDDVFLIQQMAQIHPEKISFIVDPEAIVLTYAESKWSAFFRQRFRWAGKSSAYSDRKLQLVEVLVFLMNICLLVNGFLALIYSQIGLLFLIQFVLKLFIDVLFIQSTSRKLGVSYNRWLLLPAFLFYPVYYVIIGTSALLPLRPKWKGRRI